MRGLPAALLALLSAMPAALAEPPQQRPIMTLGGAAHFLGASVDMNFATGQYFGLTPGQLTVSRASTEYEVCNGQLFGPFANNALAVTPGCGAWVWEARTNSITNSTATGATPGTPGVQPTNWTVRANNNVGTLVVNVAGQGTEGGIAYTDFQFVGTPTGAGYFQFLPELNTTIPATYGQTWSASMFVRMVAGSTANTSGPLIGINEYTSGGVFVANSSGAGNISGTILGSSRSNFSRTLTGATTANAGPFFLSTYAAGAVNITLRIGLPQLELNPNLPASVASAVKAASGTGGVNGAGVYTITGGTCATQPTTNVTWAAGVLTIGAVVNAGSCTVLPPSPATLAYSSGAATGWTGATATLTPVDNSAQGFGTGPILTSSGAVTRAATTANSPALAAIVAGKSGTIMADAQIFAPVGNSTPLIFQADDGTFNNRREAFPNVGNMVQVIFNNVGSGSTSQNFSNGGGSFSTASRRSVVTWTPSTQSVTFDGSTPVSSASAPAAVGISQFYIGSSNLSSAPLNGFIKEIAIWPYAVANPQQLSTAGYR